jgi:hypothetical protein
VGVSLRLGHGRDPHSPFHKGGTRRWVSAYAWATVETHTVRFTRERDQARRGAP